MNERALAILFAHVTTGARYVVEDIGDLVQGMRP